MGDEGLFSDLKEWVDSIPLVDIHCHINGEKPAAEDPKEIIFYHYIATELMSAGAPPKAFSPNISFEEAMKLTLPYFKMIRNTSTYWCLMKILRDLYGFEENEINEKNWRRIQELILSHVDEENWYRRVLKTTNFEKGFLTFRYEEKIPKFDPEYYTGALRIEPLITRLNKDDVKALEKAVNASVESINDFEEALSLLFKKFHGRVVAVTASIRPEEDFTEPNREKADESIRKRIFGSKLDESGMLHLRSYAINLVLSLAEEYNLPVQLMIGVRRPVAGASPPDYAIVGFETKFLLSLCQLFHKFRDVSFDIFLANKLQSHELTVIAKNYPNVHVSGYWWYVFYPTIIQEFLLERLQMLPQNKINGFFSDAYVVEWVYGKASLVRLQIAEVLTRMVKNGYYDKDLAKNIAENLLLHNPKKLYLARQSS